MWPDWVIYWTFGNFLKPLKTIVLLIALEFWFKCTYWNGGLCLAENQRLLICLVDFLNGRSPASFSFIFGLLKQIFQFLQQIYVTKCPSSTRCRDSNAQPSEHGSLTITTSTVWIYVESFRIQLSFVKGRRPRFSLSPKWLFHSIRRSDDPGAEDWDASDVQKTFFCDYKQIIPRTNLHCYELGLNCWKSNKVF